MTNGLYVIYFIIALLIAYAVFVSFVVNESIKRTAKMSELEIHNHVRFDILSDEAAEKEHAAKVETARLQIVNRLPSEIAKQPARLKEFEADLAADVAAHAISFSRYGDFVAVAQERRGRKTLTAIPIGDAAIELRKGRPPSLEKSGWAYQRAGSLYFHINNPLNFAKVYVATGLADGAKDDEILFGAQRLSKHGAVIFEPSVISLPCGLGEAAFAALLAVVKKGVPK